MSKVTEFERVCVKKDGHISHRAHYLFNTIDGRNCSSDDTIIIHPWHVSSGRGFSTVVDNAEQIRKILRSIRCPFTEGNDAPRGGQSGAFISIRKRDLIDSLISAFGAEKGRKIYRELGVSQVLTAEAVEYLKNLEQKCVGLAMLSPYYYGAWSVIHLGADLQHAIAVFPDEQ